MEGPEMLAAILGYLAILAFAVAWFLLPPRLFGARAILTEQTRLAWQQSHRQHRPRKSRLSRVVG